MNQRTERVACNLCGSQKYRTFCTKFGLRLVRCRSCGLVFANPRLVEEEILKRYNLSYFFDEYLPGFGADREAYNLGILRNRYSFYLEILDRCSPPGRRLLDVGSGAGFFLKVAQEKGWEGEGVEISEGASAYAREIVGVKVHHRNIEEMNFPEEVFDAVTLLDMIEHLRDPLRSVTGMKQILRKGGFLLINTPDLDSLSRYFLGDAWAVLSPAEHLFNFNQKSLRFLLERAGLSVLGIHNLLVFNPDYTHDRDSRRYSIWKKEHERLEKKKWMQKIHSFEQSDILRVVGKDAASFGFRKNVLRFLYRMAKTRLRGDTLVAIGQKN